MGQSSDQPEDCSSKQKVRLKFLGSQQHCKSHPPSTQMSNLRGTPTGMFYLAVFGVQRQDEYGVGGAWHRMARLAGLCGGGDI